MKEYFITVNGIEQIIDDEYLYRYLPIKAFPEGQNVIPTDYFTDTDLSCDWVRLQDKPEQSPRVIKDDKRGIAKIKICRAIRLPLGKDECPFNQEIRHSPSKGNDSHSVINGTKKLPVTKAISNNTTLYKIVT